jgi:hypothetical protein
MVTQEDCGAHEYLLITKADSQQEPFEAYVPKDAAILSEIDGTVAITKKKDEYTVALYHTTFATTSHESALGCSLCAKVVSKMSSQKPLVLAILEVRRSGVRELLSGERLNVDEQ